MKVILSSLLTALLAWSAWAAGPININAATAEQIAEALQGVGLSKAQEIVRYREQHGAFKDADELVNVKGIGLRTVDKNRDLILIQDSKAPAKQ